MEWQFKPFRGVNLIIRRTRSSVRPLTWISWLLLNMTSIHFICSTWSAISHIWLCKEVCVRDEDEMRISFSLSPSLFPSLSHTLSHTLFLCFRFLPLHFEFSKSLWCAVSSLSSGSCSVALYGASHVSAAVLHVDSSDPADGPPLLRRHCHGNLEQHHLIPV